MAVLEACQLVKEYGSGHTRVQALGGVSFSVQPGEFVAIMGPSGSGKSTLLTLLGGVEAATSGQVLLNGQDMASLSDDDRTKLRRKQLGFIFQSFNLLPNLSAVENVALPLRLDGLNKRQATQQALDALTTVEMQQRSDHLPSALSGGEQQRVAIARALVIKPTLLLADEPTGNLDSRQASRISKLLRELVDQQAQTIVMVTHDAAIARIASRLILLRDGQVESDHQSGQFEIPEEATIASK